MRKFIRIAIAALFAALIITIYGSENIINEPEISVKFNVVNLTNKEFLYVGTKGLDNPTKEDFKNIEFNLAVNNSDAISNRNITIPNLKAVADSYDKKRYWFGDLGTDESPGNNYTKYNYKFIFYSKGLNEQDIKNIFNSSEVKISWTTSNDRNEEKIIKLGDVIQFQG